MLHFPKEYFQPEYREDFLVDATMKTVWAAEMELLSDVAAVCKKYGLQYYAGWGTLLGAVRHKGFVPWDDDMDITLKRKDYEILMKVLPKELPETYKVYYPLSEAGHNRFWGLVVNADTISIEEARLRKFHGCPFWVGIDIFPLDHLPRDAEEAQILHELMILIWKAADLAKKEDKTPKEAGELEELAGLLEETLNITIDRQKPLLNELWRLGNLLAMSYVEEDGDLLTEHWKEVMRPGFSYQSAWWDNVIEVPFEVTTVPIPAGYDPVLRTIYGDYSIRVRGESNHEYPYYQNQLQQLRDKVKEMEEKKSLTSRN